MDVLETLGYNDWFQARADTEKAAAHELARVIGVHKESYVVTKGGGDVFAELSGNLLYSTNDVADLPTTGDWVYVDFYDDDSHAIIHGVTPRKTLLKRKAAGKLVDFQLIAANLDLAFIVQSVNENFNLSRLERYLVMVNEGGITPVILLSKCDLISSQALADIEESLINTAAQVTVLSFSNLDGHNIDAIKDLLLPSQTCCLLGSSGVGKTTLLNTLIGRADFETRTVSKKKSKGRHTTTSRELIQLDGGAMLIDTPGMRELGNLSVDVGLDETFADILALSLRCQFSNCAHTNEKGCAIQAAINIGELSGKRYKNYTKMKKESVFNEMSYVEKKNKDKRLGKSIKLALKAKNKR